MGPDAGAERLRARVRRRWERIDWSSPIPPGTLVMAEAHYLDVGGLGLGGPQRVGLNRLFACFTCELFIHFEAYLIRYLERHPLAALPPAARERFVAEERVHSEMFRRLLHRLRPDLYPAAAAEDAPLRFLRWTRGDDLALRLAPAGTFFLLAWLFEEITLFVPRALDACPEQCSTLLSEVMRLHAREEQPHVAIDERLLRHRGAGRKWAGLEAALALPLLVYVDGKAQSAWRRMIGLAAAEIGLSAGQRARLRRRGPSQSDRWGMESFVEKLARSGIAGAGILCWALRRQLGGPAA